MRISRICRTAPLKGRNTKVCMWGEVPYVITSSSVISIGSGVSDFWGSKNWGFPLTRQVALTTVLHYRADCDRQIGVEESKYRVTGDSPFTGREAVTWPTFEIMGPRIFRERLEIEMSNLACRFITRGINEINAKLGQRRSGKGHVTYFWNSGTASISREQLEPETSNLARRFITRGINKKNAK